MAKSSRAWLFGNDITTDQQRRINPIHRADLAEATADAIDQGSSRLDVGGPDIFTHKELAELAFACLDKPAKITYLWDGLRTLTIRLLPWITPLHVYGPTQFFLTVMGMDMVGECRGTHRLRDHFAALNAPQKEKQQQN